MPKFLSIKNFESYQHYKHRNPPWIKLHLSILDDPDFLALADASKWHYIGLLLLASRHENAVKPDYTYIANRLGLTEKLSLSARFLKDHVLAPNASNVHTNADSEKSRDRVEKSRVETEPPSASSNDGFEMFWEAYPKKVGKGAALQAWRKVKTRPPVLDIIQAIESQKKSEQWSKENGQFIPNPSTWLNQGRWADQLAQAKPTLAQEFFQRHAKEEESHGLSTVLRRVAATHCATMGATIPGSARLVGGAEDDDQDPARAVL